MPNIDPSIPLSYKPADMLSTIGSVAGIANTITQAKRGQVSLEQEQGNLDARKRVGAVIADPQYKAEDGTFDLSKATPAIIQADPENRVASEIISKMAGANNDLITVKKNALSLAGASRSLIGNTVGAMANRDDLTKREVETALGILEQQAPDAKPSIEVWRKHLAGVADNPQQLKQAVMSARSQVMDPSAQIASQTPEGPVMGNGQQTQMMNVKPTAGPIGPVPGTAVQQQLPPTTPTFDPATQTPGYLGAQPPAVVPPAVQTQRNGEQIGILQKELAQEKDPANREAIAKEIAALQGAQGRGQPFTSQRPVQSGPKLGEVQNVAGTVDAANKDWETTTKSASTAAQDIGVLQKIKQLAPGAVAGVAQDRRAYIAGLAGLLGMEPAQLEKTKTDELMKNSAMLALAGGNTDLARILSESANPNVHMTKEAIQNAANQIIAQRKLALAKQQYMQHFKGDPEQYSKELTNFNQIADPRALQINEMSEAELKSMKAAMSAAEQKEFRAKLSKLKAIGVVQ